MLATFQILVTVVDSRGLGSCKDIYTNQSFAHRIFYHVEIKAEENLGPP